ncbi:MAG: spore germination protein, partial [Oscillospiraceae bacterium]|nr:spore germination protein [Oscillospiraceae bacterium]
MQEESVHTHIPESVPVDASLDRNLKNIKIMTGNSSDVITKTAMVGGNRIAVLTCEGMTSTDTLSELIYQKLNNVGNEEHIPPGELVERIFDIYLIAAEQIEIKNIGDLVLKLQSGFAIILTDGCTKCVAIGVQGYNSRGIDEPSSELNVRGSREGFIEVIRTNMSMIRRRIKSPTLVFEMSTLGDRSNTDICI